MADILNSDRRPPEDDHTHTFVSYPAPSGIMRDTNEWLEACVHPGCMAIRGTDV